MREPFCKARFYLNTMMTMEMLIGFAVIMTTFFYQSFLSKYVVGLQNGMYAGQLCNSYIFGVQLVLAHMAGLNIWQKIWHCKYSTVIEIILFSWMAMSFLIILSGMGVVWSLYKCGGALHYSAEMTMRQGMDLYFDSPEWKLLWDGLQYHKQCCGIKGYRDWMRAAWMPNFRKQQEDDIDSESEADTDEEEDLYEYIERRSRKSKLNNTVFAPYTCCKQSSPLCYGSNGPVKGYNKYMAALSVKEINTKGCLPFFSDTMSDLCKVLSILTCLSLISNIVICLLTKKVLCHQVLISPESTTMSFIDDEGRAVVYLKYPPNVNCITVNESTIKGGCVPAATTPPCSPKEKFQPKSSPGDQKFPLNLMGNQGGNDTHQCTDGEIQRCYAPGKIYGFPICDSCGMQKARKSQSDQSLEQGRRFCQCERCPNPRILH